MGLLNRQGGKPGMGPPMGPPMTQPPPQMGQMGRGMPGAFGSNPEFMAQLQQMMQRQPFTAPRVAPPQTPGQPAGGAPLGGGMMGGGGYGGGMMGGFQMPQQPYMDNDMMGMGDVRMGGYGGARSF